MATPRKYPSQEAILDALTEEPVNFTPDMDIEADEAASWIRNDKAYEHPFAVMLFGGFDFPAKTMERADVLLERVMNATDVDDLVELRNIIRSAFIDMARAEICEAGVKYQAKWSLPPESQAAKRDWDDLRAITDRLVYGR